MVKNLLCKNIHTNINEHTKSQLKVVMMDIAPHQHHVDDKLSQVDPSLSSWKTNSLEDDTKINLNPFKIPKQGDSNVQANPLTFASGKVNPLNLNIVMDGVDDEDNEDGPEGVELVSRKLILSLACDFRLRFSDEPWSDKRQETLEKLLRSVNTSKIKEHEKVQREERQQCKTKEKILLENFSQVAQEEFVAKKLNAVVAGPEKTPKEPQQYFKGIEFFQDLARHTRIASQVEQNLRGEEVMRRVSALPNFRTPKIGSPNQSDGEQDLEAIKEDRRRNAETIATESRIRSFKRKAQIKKEQNTVKKMDPKLLKAKYTIRNTGNKIKMRELKRKKFLNSVRNLGGQPKNRDNVKPNISDAASVVSMNEKHRKKAPSTKTLGAAGSVVSETNDFATRFYKQQRCQFNSTQMDCVERVFKSIVKDLEDKRRFGNRPASPQQSVQPIEGEQLTANQLALQQKGFTSRKVITLQQLQKALSRTFDVAEDGLITKRIYSVMCGRDAASKREGLTFAKFATFMSTLFLGSCAQKMFVFFEMLDMDRDGYLSKHDIFTLLRSDAESCAPEDFEVLLNWVLRVNENRLIREQQWELTQKRKKKIRKQMIKRMEAARNLASPGSPKMHQDDSSDEDDNISIGSYDSATEWMASDPAEEQKNFEALLAINEKEGQLDFESFRYLWPKKYTPQLIRLICDAFPMISKEGSKRHLPGFRNGNNNNNNNANNNSGVPPQNASTVSQETVANGDQSIPPPPDNATNSAKSSVAQFQIRKPMPPKKGVRKVMEASLQLNKAKLGLINSLRTRLQDKAIGIRPELLKGGSLASNVSDADKFRPGKFLRELNLDVHTARHLRGYFNQMRPDLQGRVQLDGFCDVLLKAKVGLERKPQMRYLCERLFVAANSTRDGNLTFSDFLTIYVTAKNGQRRDCARYTFDMINASEQGSISAQDAEKIIESGMEDIDPVLSHHLLNLLVDKITRSEPAFIYKEDLITLGEVIQVDKEHLSAQEAERRSLAERACAASNSPEDDLLSLKSGSRRGSMSSVSSYKMGGSRRGSLADSASIGSSASRKGFSFAIRTQHDSSKSEFSEGASSAGRRRRRTLRKDRSLSSSKELLPTFQNTEEEAAIRKADLIASQLHEMELQSIKKREDFLCKYRNVEYILLHKLVEAFAPSK